MADTVHEEVLKAANEIACARPDWTFTPGEVVARLRHLNENSVRTHVVSRCCKNAPRNHAHRWGYFRRLSRGTYQIEAPFRRLAQGTPQRRGGGKQVDEPTSKSGNAQRSVIHAIAHRDGDTYVAECMEVAVVTQAETLDQLIENLRDAISLHLEGEDLGEMGLAENPRIQIIVELPIAA